MSIRLQLLIVALTTLILPWAGCQYAQELETALRDAQEQSLLASAGIIANALSAQPQRVFRESGRSQSFAADRGDLYVFPLRGQPLLDGYREDWGVYGELSLLPSRSGYRARVLAGSTERYLYLYFEVDDPNVGSTPSAIHPERDSFARIDVALERPDGSTAAYFFTTHAPGLIAAHRMAKGEDGTERVTEEPRIQAYWLQNERTYHLEARIPLSLVGAHVWLGALAGHGGGRAGISPADSAVGGRLFFATLGLNELLATFIAQGTRATVVDSNGLRLGSAGNVGTRMPLDGEDPGRLWYRYFMPVDTSELRHSGTSDRLDGNSVTAALGGQPHAEWMRGSASQELLLAAAAPIAVEGRSRGAVVLEQNGDQLLALRDGALKRLFNLTLLATAAAVLIMFGMATWISLRIGRLRSAADAAVGSDGKIRLDMPESSRADEIGALARGFERLLARLDEHTHYLRTLGGKLSHELRTPLTIVRSSLDNLESDGLREDQRGFVNRAREGSQRLQFILSALGAAARVEESITQAERVNFDLRELLPSTVAAYRDGFPQARFALETPQDACFIRGAPDLIVQLLDKLIENAVDFSPPAGVITVCLGRSGGHYVLSVSNDGPPIPPALLGRLFESLFEHRQGHDDKPHFGLGLYIVRLVAEFHGGAAVAANRGDSEGVVITVTLPLL